MAKDVDLSSKEWTDIVFDHKNQDYGAYVIRQKSVARHNKAMIVVVLILALIAILAVVVNTVIKSAEARPEDAIEQTMVEMATTDEVEEEVEEEQQRVEEQQPEEVLKEEILNTAKMTEIAVVEDEEVKEEIKSQDEMKEDERAVGTVNEDRGVDDIINAQEHKDAVVVEEKKPVVEENHVFTSVEQMPTFPGGDAALLKWVGEHLRYPAAAQENGVQGRVVVQFVVTKNGTVGEVKVVRSKDPDLDKEAIRVVKSLPKFVPGKMNGQAVNVWYTLPITFKLQGV